MATHAHLFVAGNQCVVHKSHRPEPLRSVHHHIWPQEFGGPTVPENLVWVCDTGHYNIHAILTLLIAGSTAHLPGSLPELALARQGFDRITRHAL